MAPFWGKATLNALMAAGVISVIAGQAYAASGDWPMLNYDRAGTRHNRYETILNAQNVNALQLAWQVDIGDVYSSPVVADGVLFIPAGYKLYALNAMTGATIWATTLHYSVATSPAVANGIVYVTDSGVLTALDAETGTILWNQLPDPPAGGYGSNPIVDGSRVFVEDSDGSLYAYIARSGVRLWKVPAIVGCPINSIPAIAQGIVYTQNLAGIYALDIKTGRYLWSQRFGVSSGSPVVRGGFVYAQTGDSVAAFDAKTGTKKWAAGFENNGAKDGGFAITRNHLFATFLEQPAIWDFKTKSGQFKSKQEEAPFAPSPTFANDVLYTVSTAGVSAYDAKSMKQLWIGKFDNKYPYTSPVVSHGMVYAVSGSKGSLHAYALRN